MNILVAGGSGFIGKTLIARLLQLDHSVIVLTRSPQKVTSWSENLRVEQWNAESLGSWTEAIEGADAVINLTGELIAGKRWTKRQKDLILKSRVNSTRAIASAIAQTQRKPAILLNVSAVGFYGNVPEGEVTETTPRGNDFLAEVCAQWEAEAITAEHYGVRVVTPRLGVVLALDGGALTKLIIPFRFFAGGYVGTGRQWFPWVHITDVINVFLFILNNPSVAGPVNVATPNPVTMKQFTHVLGKVMHRPSWSVMPPFVLRLALGEMAGMLLSGQRVVPLKLLGAGFVFGYETAQAALTDLLKREL